MSRRFIPFAAMLLVSCQGERPPADPGAILTARTLGLAYIEENRLPEAEEQFLKLIRLVPDEPSGHANLGLVHMRMGRYDDAQREIDRAANLAPDDPDIRLLQATALRLRGRTRDARRTLEDALKSAPAHVKTLYALADLDSANGEGYLQRVVAAAPANVPARLALAQALLERGAITEARDQLELLRQRLPSLPSQAERFYAASVTDLQANRAEDARANLARAKAFLETTAVYQAGLAELRAPDGVPPGYPVLTLNPRLALLQRDPLAVVKALRFTDVTAIVKPPAIRDASGDYDNDGHVDYFDQGVLFHNRGDDTFTRSNAIAVPPPDATTAVFVDLDHDGDLDLFVGSPAGGGDRFYRNNGDGTFKEMAATAGLAGSGATNAAFGDFDNDGRIDLAVARPSGVTVYRGGEQGRFDTLASLPASAVVAAGDYDNDGFLDLYAGSFYHNDGTGKLTRDSRADVPRVDLSSVAFLDFDNDGWLDLIGATASKLVLLHNNEKGGFTDRSALLAPTPNITGRIRPVDLDDDGDLDLVVGGRDRRVHVLRNDGGNVNQFVKIGLVALREGSGKNNSFGIGARVELRAKDLYQMQTADQPVLHFGLGNRLKPDVLKVTWTNGVPQTYYYPGGSAAGEDRNVLEQQVLKGSCTFLYTWDGTAYQFLTDVTWASALGMPLGLMAGEQTIYGPPQAAREYFRIPGERLQATQGRYRIQLTEELWEVAYVDQLELLAVDHPDSVDVFVDERFVPPGTEGAGRLAIRQAGTRRGVAPIAATDERGRDLLQQIRAKDDDYVGGFIPGPYQGVTALHDLVLDFGAVPDGGGPARLVLQGWLFPTDASINAAIAQSKAVQILPPVVQVRDKSGRWRTVADLTFPAGKDKSIIVDMTGRWLSTDRRIRVRTNLEIYWDHAFLAVGDESAPVTVTRLQPVAADLHARGWSRVYRKGGRYGPFWFDYAQVTKQSPWRPVGGNFTRYGDVLPLLAGADDRAAILASGDEMTVEFPEGAAPPLPAGWKRDFLLYNVAWMKDADLHTATGQTVEPLPFHAAARYPYAPAQHYPDDAAHRRYVAEYNTRRVVP